MSKKNRSPEDTGLDITKEQKRTAALIAALSLAFNLCVASPIDFYLNNQAEVGVPYILIMAACFPVGVVLFAAVYLLLRLTRGKAFVISLSAVVGINTAAYIQANFFTIGMAKLDGTAYTVSALRAAADLLFWAAMIALPLVLFRFAKNAFKRFVLIVPLSIIIMELAAILSTTLEYKSNGLINEDLMYPDQSGIMTCQVDNEFTFSKEENHIVFIVDQYDSFIFDEAVTIEPDSVSSFDGFTYYNNTIGMYDCTIPSITYLFTQKATENKWTLQKECYKGDTFFNHIPDEYSAEIYTDDDLCIPDEALQRAADNFKRQPFSLENYVNIGAAMYDMVLYRNVPDIAKGFFWMYSGDFSNKMMSVKTYFSENYLFYKSLPTGIGYTDKPCYKLYYLKGLHSTRYTDENINYLYPDEVPLEKCAIGVNKILSKYLDLLKEGGVYDNSDIIIMADHGHRPNYDAKYPLLMIKRKNDTFDGIRTSSVPVSYADLFPTGCYLLGDESMKDKSIFALREGQKRERYFAETDEYITEDVDRSLPLHK